MRLGAPRGSHRWMPRMPTQAVLAAHRRRVQAVQAEPAAHLVSRAAVGQNGAGSWPAVLAAAAVRTAVRMKWAEPAETAGYTTEARGGPARPTSRAVAAAGRAATVLARDKMEALSIVSTVEERACSGCRLCNTVCAYDAISFDVEKGVSAINPAVCKGCGTCVAACPTGAMQQHLFSADQLMAEMEGVLQ